MGSLQPRCPASVHRPCGRSARAQGVAAAPKFRQPTGALRADNTLGAAETRGAMAVGGNGATLLTLNSQSTVCPGPDSSPCPRKKSASRQRQCVEADPHSVRVGVMGVRHRRVHMLHRHVPMGRALQAVGHRLVQMPVVAIVINALGPFLSLATGSFLVSPVAAGTCTHGRQA